MDNKKCSFVTVMSQNQIPVAGKCLGENCNFFEEGKCLIKSAAFAIFHIAGLMMESVKAQAMLVELMTDDEENDDDSPEIENQQVEKTEMPETTSDSAPQ